jgi:hypothetical protein
MFLREFFAFWHFSTLTSVTFSYSESNTAYVTKKPLEPKPMEAVKKSRHLMILWIFHVEF